MKLSIIIPAHNEEDNIASVIEKIEGVISGIDYELVVVNDHSSDRTGAIIAEASRKYDNIRLAVNNMDRGFANALRAGFRSSSGDVVISVMADLCDDLATIRAMWDKVGAGYDVVCGCRYIKGGKRVGGSKIKGFFSSFVGHSLHLLFGIPTHDVANAFKMYRRNVIEAMKTTSRSFEISMELALKAYYLGFKVT